MSSQVMSSKVDTQGSASTSTTMSTSNLASELKPQGNTASQVKPCCVCKDEKAERDNCMLFSNSNDPQKDCESIMSKYRSCMAGYGFTI